MPLHETSSSAGSLNDGWVPAGETWTYASATTFTVSGVDVTAKYSKGTRIKLTQTTAKYFVVVASSFSTDTTVTVTGGTDYTLANAAITNPFFSYAANPQGYPGWFSYTPTYSGFSADPSGSSVFSITGRVVVFLHHPTAGTSNATGFTLTVPVALQGANRHANCRITNNGANATTPGLVEGTTTSATLTVYQTHTGTAWTASGSKNATFDFTYLI